MTDIYDEIRAAKVNAAEQAVLRHLARIEGREPDPTPEEVIATLRAENARLREALTGVVVPLHGVCGGPIVGLRAIYEDGTDENTARHKGWVSHNAMITAVAALSATGARNPASDGTE